MKKFLKITLVIISIMLVLVAFCGCKGTKGEVKVIVFGNDGYEFDSYLIDTTGKDIVHLVDALEYLKNDSEISFTYDGTGGYINSVNGYVPVSGATSGEFWAIYTDCSIEGLDYFDISWGTCDFNNNTFGSASKGISELPLTKGATYIIKLSTW